MASGPRRSASNIQTDARFERLTRRDWRQVRRPSPGTRDLARDGKLKFGTVSGAVLAVLAEARSRLRYIEISRQGLRTPNRHADPEGIGQGVLECRGHPPEA